MSESDLGKSKHGIPDVVMQQIDKYVDGLAPQIQPLITTEIDVFQQKTVDSLEDKVVEAFRSLFDKSEEKHSDSRSLDGAPPDSYGIGSLPFANEIQGLSRTFTQITSDAQGDLQQILNITEGGGSNEHERSRGGPGEHQDSFSDGARGFLSAAIGAVSEHARKESGGQPVVFDGFLGALSNAVKDSSRNPEEKARMISPEIKEKVGAILRNQHAPIAEQFTRIALDHIKKWLRGNTSSRDLGDGAKDEIKNLVKGVAGLFSHKKEPEEGSRDLPRGEGDSSGGGFSKMISDKLSTGIAQVHREVRLEFRKILGTIEKSLFEALPDQFQGPLEKILGGNPFDSSLDSQANTSRGLGDDIKGKLVESIRRLVRKVQETLREKILEIVNGGHRKFEKSSWVFVQNKVEEKVQRFLPDVRITVPDDIGNEGVDVGKPDQGKLHTPPAGGMPPAPSQGNPPPSHDNRPPQHDYQPPGQGYQPPRHDNPPPSHEYRPEGPGGGYQPGPGQGQDYRPQGSGHGYQPGQGQYTSGPQEHQYPPPPSQHNAYGSGPPSQSYPPPPPSYPPPPQSYPPQGGYESGGSHQQGHDSYQRNDYNQSYDQQQPPYDRR
ncbi:hypothetical protein PG996_014667 [Apiospora saccharicola]|uniref:Uncharacterized protein n=1 Tax=Apiospora saccharicola TaxID=335842 RepID=A0ABR1TIZ1_9PEZI